MKKTAVLLLVAAMAISIMACGEQGKSPEKETETQQMQQQDEEETENAQTSNDIQEDDASKEDIQDTVGNILMNDFKERMASNPQSTAQEIADGLLENQVLDFQGATMPVEPGLLNGFGNADIKGFKEGVMFSPMIGSIPFVGYIFVVEDDVDVEEFKGVLRENADLRWNVCTEADEMMVENADHTVFFLMSPSTFENQM